MVWLIMSIVIYIIYYQLMLIFLTDCLYAFARFRELRIEYVNVPLVFVHVSFIVDEQTFFLILLYNKML